MPLGQLWITAWMARSFAVLSQPQILSAFECPAKGPTVPSNLRLPQPSSLGWILSHRRSSTRKLLWLKSPTARMTVVEIGKACCDGVQRNDQFPGTSCQLRDPALQNSAVGLFLPLNQLMRPSSHCSRACQTFFRFEAVNFVPIKRSL